MTHVPTTMGRRYASRWLAAGVAVAAAVAGPLLVAPAAAAQADVPPPTTCAIEQLKELPDWTMSLVSAADPTGRYIAGRGYPKDPHNDFHRFPTIWVDGEPTVVDVPGEDQLITDINSRGDAVAIGYREGELFADGWLYRDGELTQLSLPGSVDHLTINDRGDIAGTYQDGDTTSAFVIRSGSDKPEPLPVPDGGTFATAWDIADDGTVVGAYTDADQVMRAYMWSPEGEGKELLSPGGQPGAYAMAIRGDWIVGAGRTDDGAVPMRWDRTTGKATEFPQFQLRPEGVNIHGWMVGFNHSGRGLFVSDAGDIVLPGLVDHNDPFGDIAYTVTDDGRTIAGQAIDGTGTIHAVVWRCQ